MLPHTVRIKSTGISARSTRRGFERCWMRMKIPKTVMIAPLKKTAFVFSSKLFEFGKSLTQMVAKLNMKEVASAATMPANFKGGSLTMLMAAEPKIVDDALFGPEPSLCVLAPIPVGLVKWSDDTSRMLKFETLTDSTSLEGRLEVCFTLVLKKLVSPSCLGAFSELAASMLILIA